jgi:CHRD domain
LLAILLATKVIQVSLLADVCIQQILDSAMTSLSFTVTVTGLDFTGTQTADLGDDLLAAHIHAPAAPGANAGVKFGFFGQPFNDTNPNDVVVTPFASGVGGTIFSKWDLAEGNNTTLTAQLPNILAGQSYINFHTRRLPGGEIRGQIQENPQVTANIQKVFSYGRRNSFGFPAFLRLSAMISQYFSNRTKVLYTAVGTSVRIISIASSDCPTVFNALSSEKKAVWWA